MADFFDMEDDPACFANGCDDAIFGFMARMAKEKVYMRMESLLCQRGGKSGRAA